MNAWIFFGLLAFFSSTTYSANITTLPKPSYCKDDTLKAQWWSIPPYIYKDKDGNINGIFKRVLDDIVKHCCNGHTNITYEPLPLNDSEVVKDHIGENGTVISFPIYGEMKDTTFQNFPYMPVVEAPGVVFIMTTEDSANAAEAVMGAVFQGWPVLVLTLVMAALSGIIIWALDTYWNPDEFPPSFFQGAWEGFWWAFVSMTTVGYGDRSPRSFFARAFSFVWIMIGLVIISIFTATVTTSLTAISLSNEIKLYGSDVVALKNTEEQRFGVRNNAKVGVRFTVEQMKNAIINKEDDTIGGLLDSYVAGYWAQNKDNVAQPLADPLLQVGTVFDHQFAYGFVIAAGYEKNEEFEKCTRKKLNSMETEITKIIQDDAKTMEESGESAAVQKTQNLFDPESPIFQKAIFCSLGLVVGLTLLGLIWEYAYWRPRQPKPKTTEVERVITPHTSYEELVAQQSAEIEEIMRNEVQRFYNSWNQKLEDLKFRNSKLKAADELKEDHHERYDEEKQRLSDDEAEEMEEMDDYNDVNMQSRKSPFSASDI
ncbi:uncharacterized protein LOC114517780 [Dendronephthya gigantea]|uniref:uncharacterized protein LOC114517780 n=1 Tax=Dendronephthya gigantea TaxID=151771 RepID=UPI00106D74B6|nr:uncharacterized protein LOC114517780 [Dendronephthya gigantea]